MHMSITGESKSMRVVLVLAGLFVCGASVNAAELYSKTDLFAEPGVQSEVTGTAPKGEVSVLERRGYWVKVQSGKKIVGWIKLSKIKMQEKIKWMKPIDTLHDTGRLSSGH